MTRNRKSAKRNFLFFISVLVIFFLGACEKPTISLSNTFINNGNTNIIVVDTMSADLSTVFVDSFPSAGTRNMLLGTYNDPYFGVVTSKSFVQIGPPVNLPTISNLAGFDSLVLIMRINKNFYGDTTVNQRYYAAQLQSVIQLPTTQITFFNNQSFPFDPNSPLGFADAQISPTAGFTSQKDRDSLKMKFPDNLGQQLFGMLYNKSDTVKNENTFIGFFKGLCIYPDESRPGSIFGFTDSVIMRLYYHEPGVFSSSNYVDFPMNDGSKQFNNIAVNRAGTPTEPINATNREVPSTATDNIAFIQSTTGLETKVRFPYLWKLIQRPDYISVLKAQLIIKPITGTYSPTLSLPPALNLFITDNTNFIGSPIVLNGSPQSGNLVVDYLYGQNTSYTYDITSYIQQQISAGAENNAINGLMITLPASASSFSFNRAVIGDKYNLKNNNIMLKLYYISFY